MPDIESLKTIALFNTLSDEELECLKRVIAEEVYEPDQHIFHEGDIGDTLYVISSGEIQIRKLIDPESGKDKLLATLTAGDFFGEMSLYSGETRSASVLAFTRSTVYSVKKTDYDSLLESDFHLASALSQSIIKILSSRLRAASRELVTLYDTGKIVGSVSDVEELAETILVRLKKTLAAETGIFAVFSELSGSIEIVRALGYQDSELISALRFRPGEGLIGRLFVEGTMQVRNDVDPNEMMQEFGPDDQNAGIKAYLGVPLKPEPSRVVGVILLGDTTASAFTLSERNLLSGVALQVAPAVENAMMKMENKARQDYNRVYITPNL